MYIDRYIVDMEEKKNNKTIHNLRHECIKNVHRTFRDE